MVRGVRAIVEISAPGFQLSVEPVEIEIGKRAVTAREISHTALQHRARPHKIARGVVMKSDRQLNHPLEMQSQGGVGGRGAPDVFKNLVRVEEQTAVEEAEAAAQFPVDRLSTHIRIVSKSYPRCPGLANPQSTCFHSFVEGWSPQNRINSKLKTHVIETYGAYLILFWNADCT